MNRLYNKARGHDNVFVFREHLPELPAFGENPYDPVIDGVNVANHLELLAEQALVKGLARYDAGADKHGLRNCVNTASYPYPNLFTCTSNIASLSQARAEDAANTVFSLTSTVLYGEYVNRHLKESNMPDLHALLDQPDFLNSLKERMHQPHFIPAVFRQDLANYNDHTYTTALVFCYDWLHFGPGFTPHLDGSFQSAHSGTLLAKWATTLGMKSDHDKTDIKDLPLLLLHFSMESEIAPELSSLGLYPIWSVPWSRSA